MAKQTPSYDVIDELEGAEQHHKLKNRPGEKGDPNHTDDDLGQDSDADREDKAD